MNKVLRAGDVLVCARLDRVGRSTAHLVLLPDEFRQRDVAFRFLEQGIDTSSGCDERDVSRGQGEEPEQLLASDAKMCNSRVARAAVNMQP
ncbi:recombinase family protein [Saccharopolyspora shandongensis]|uniref:recombinase family protein n=1 Tax=Saccharopolyspora shandongensis TaxID=418495 RepID=UPI003F4CD748